MKPFIILLLILTLTSLRIDAQTSVVRGKITFITAEYVYTTLGRNDNLRDSMRVAVLSRTDTVAVLRVAALSSKSSACTLISSKRKPVVGDSVVALISAEKKSIDSTGIAHIPGAPAVPPTGRTGINVTEKKKSEATPAWLKLQGRISAQYFALYFDEKTLDQKTPGMSVNLRGSFTGSSLSFQMSGNFRSIIRDASVIAPGQSSNQTRIYSASIDYNDGENLISVGRVSPPFSPFLGSVDGGYAAHTFGPLTFGLSGGFEPYRIPGIAFTDQKKFALFAGYQSTDHRTLLGSVTYSRSYYQTTLIREVLGGMVTCMPTDLVYFTIQSEFDLRTKLNDQLSMKGKLTSILANVNVSVLRGLSFGVGVAAWRPTYFFPSIQPLANNFVDLTLRATPTFTANCSLIRGVYVSNSYSPRTSDSAFGKEYMNNSSIQFSDFLGSGVHWGATYTLNATSLSDSKGYNVNAQRELFRGAQIDLRYQTNRYTMRPLVQTIDSHDVAGTLMLQIFQQASFWIGVDRYTGNSNPFTSINTELSYRF
jgi:hypothetical protein